MKAPIDIGNKFRENIYFRYPSFVDILQENYQTELIQCMKEDIEKYHVLFWYRLLKNIYQDPYELECELQINNVKKPVQEETAIFRKTDEKNNWSVLRVSDENLSKLKNGEIKPFPINWKYFVQLPTGGIVELGTKDRTTVFYIALIVRASNLVKKDTEEAEKFISILLDEANRLKGQLFNPKKEFEKKDGLKLYFLFNVYLENYSSAKFMLSIADSQETGLRNEFLRYDLRTDDIHDDQKRKHTHQFMLQCGMFYISAITFFFMALEGFVNIVFHAFLKKDLRDKDLNIEQRFDLEQKLKLMPYLCSGFKDEYIDQSSEIYSRFKELKKYRNSLFHSKVEDSLKRFCFVESGFTYTYDMDKDKEFLPLHKIELTINDVIKVQAIVDETINLILNSMTEAIRTLTEKYILNESLVSFWISDNGELFLGERGEQPQTLV